MKDNMKLKVPPGYDLEPVGPDIAEDEDSEARLSPHDLTQWKLAQSRVECAAVHLSLAEVTLEKDRVQSELLLVQRAQAVNRARAELNSMLRHRESYTVAMRKHYVGLIDPKSTWDFETGRIQRQEPDPEESEKKDDYAAADES